MTTPVLTATLNWAAPTLNVDGSPVVPPLTYNVYQGASPTTMVKVESGLAATTATITAGLTPGTTVYFAVSTVAQGVEGPQTTPVAQAIPFPTPDAPTALTVTLSG